MHSVLLLVLTKAKYNLLRIMVTYLKKQLKLKKKIQIP